jgi:hypothetical protein
MSEETTTEGLTRDELTELFLVQVRGTIATAFAHSGEIPDQNDWDAIRGLKEPTMRQIGEIGYRTGFNMYVQFRDRK